MALDRIALLFINNNNRLANNILACGFVVGENEQAEQERENSEECKFYKIWRPGVS